MDYRRFLAKKEALVLPYLGGRTVDAPGRRLRLAAGAALPEEGYWRFEVEGRAARPIERADAIDLSSLPAARGHYAGGWQFASQGGRAAAPVRLVPDEPPPLVPVLARVWVSGDLLFDAVEFEGDAEGEARLRLEREAPLGDVKGATPSLRAAFGFALALRVARSIGVPLGAREVQGRALELAEGGRAAAVALVARIVAERRAHEAAPTRTGGGRPRRGTSLDDAEERAEQALAAAGARLIAARVLGAQQQIEVTYEFMGERFVSLADALSLHVFDAGVCLAGADEELTLESLPSVIREAIETEQLVITRR